MLTPAEKVILNNQAIIISTLEIIVLIVAKDNANVKRVLDSLELAAKHTATFLELNK